MSIKPSVLSQIKLDILQAPEEEVSRSYTSTVEDSNIEYVNQIILKAWIKYLLLSMLALEWIVRKTKGAYPGLSI